MFLPSRGFIIYFLFFSLFSLNTSISLNSNHLQVFKDFLDHKYFQKGLIIYNSTLKLGYYDLSALFDNYYIQFLRIKPKNFFDDLERIFDGRLSRAGILLCISNESEFQENILSKVSMKGIFNNSNSWMFMGDETHSRPDVIRQTLGKMRIEANADITVAAETKGDYFQLYDVFKTCTNENASLNIEYKGNWSASSGLFIKPEFRDSFVRRRVNFCNSQIKVGTALHDKPPNMSGIDYLTNTRYHRHSDTMQRKTFNNIAMMQQMFNLSFDIEFFRSWGDALPNGSWSGVIGGLLSDEIQFSLCPVRCTSLRFKVIGCTPDLHTEGILFLFRHPRRATIRNIFFEPLSPEVWWCILALSIILSIQLGIHVYWEYRERKKPIQIEARWDFAVLQILEAMFMQGPSPDLYAFISTRTLIIAVCLFSIMLQQFYSAFIVGSLLAAPSRTITTLDALYNSSLELGMEQIPYNYEFFLNTTNQLVRNTYLKRICKNPSKNIITIEEGVERIKRGGFAFHVSGYRAYRLLIAELSESAYCELQEIAIYPAFPAGLATQKGSMYHEFLAKSTLVLRETGIIKYSEKLWAPQTIDCNLVQDNEVEVDLEHFAPALALQATAIGISFVVLLMECAWSYRKL